jgi:hypothetical protein
MRTRNRTLGGIGLAVAALATLTVTACDPYLPATKGTPVIFGVLMVDTNYNANQVFPVPPPDSPNCVLPYPEPDQAWAVSAGYAGNCDPANVAAGLPTACPVNCYPPRMGPAWAPFFQGDTTGSYQVQDPPNGKFDYTLPLAYVLNGVPPVYTAPDETVFWYSQITIQFNKLLDSSTVESGRPGDCVPSSTLRVLEGTADVTSNFSICYVPNSFTTYTGASITATIKDPDADTRGRLNPNSTYTVTGTVMDQQGATVNVLVVVRTVDDLNAVPPAVRAKK